MRKTDILLVVVFIVFVLGIAFGPALLEKWRAGKDADTVAVEPAPESSEEIERLTLEQEAEIEQVSGMLMLHKACVNRFDGFDAESRDVLEAWKRKHEAVLARVPAGQDFHIVLAQPEGTGKDAAEKAHTEEQALCERNLEAMRKDVADASTE